MSCLSRSRLRRYRARLSSSDWLGQYPRVGQYAGQAPPPTRGPRHGDSASRGGGIIGVVCLWNMLKRRKMGYKPPVAPPPLPRTQCEECSNQEEEKIQLENGG